MFGSKPRPEDVAETQAEKGRWFGRLKERLGKTRKNLGEGLANLVLGNKEINEDSLESLETSLLMADVGVDATKRIIGALTARVKRRELNNADALFTALSDELVAILSPSQRQFVVDQHRPFVVLVVGVNGVGKTTTIGKIALKLKADGLSVALAAGDTFRAAAVAQLQVWGERIDAPVISQGQGADAASVIFDALESARSRRLDVVIADTAGRLHNKANLMSELHKISRIMSRFDVDAPHEVLLVLDAVTGQNALNQAKEFMAAVKVSGIVLTKLDGTAKGGIAFALCQATGLPIYFVGVGESAEDLRPFDPREFVTALLGRDAVA